MRLCRIKMDKFPAYFPGRTSSPTITNTDITPRNIDKAEWRNNNNRESVRQQSSSSLGKEMTDSCSQSSIDSDILRAIDQGFAEYMRTDKSLQRVDSTPDPISRFFTAGNASSEFSKLLFPQSDASLEALKTCTNVKDVEEKTQSPSPLNFEKCSKSISANDHANDYDNHDNRKGRVEISHEKWSGISSPMLAERVYPNDQTSTSEEGHQRNEATKSPNGSRSSLMSRKLLDNQPRLSSSSLNFYKSTTDDDQILELKQPFLYPSFTSTVHSALSVLSSANIRDVVQEEEVFSRKQSEECNIPRTTKQGTSQHSLRQIESFHQRFVGNLSLLSGTSYNDADVEVDVADERKTSTDPVVGGCGFIGNDSVNDGKVGEQIKNCGKNSLEKDERISRDQKPPSRGETSPEGKVVSSEGLASGSNIVEDNNSGSTRGECSDQQPQQKSSSPSSEESSSCPVERIADFVKKYIDSLEGVWWIRRSVWLENNKHNPNSKRKKNSVYTYKTFKEYLAHMSNRKKTDLQVPFDLPEVEENNGNPILQDEILPTRKSSPTKPTTNTPEPPKPKLKKQSKTSRIPRYRVNDRAGSSNVSNANKKVNSTDKNEKKLPVANDDVPAQDNPCIASKRRELDSAKVQAGNQGALVLTAVKKVEEQQPMPSQAKSSPMDFSPLLEECGGIFNELNTIIHNPKISLIEHQRENRRVDEIVGIFVKKYVDFLESEWKRRRKLWAKQNVKKNGEENAVYHSFKTFKEGLANHQMEPQVPFNLPEVNATSKLVTLYEDESKSFG